jgi:hypothetical protein
MSEWNFTSGFLDYYHWSPEKQEKNKKISGRVHLSCETMQCCGWVPTFRMTLLPKCEDGGSKVIRNIGILHHYTSSQPRRRLASSPSRKPQTLQQEKLTHYFFIQYRGHWGTGSLRVRSRWRVTNPHTHSEEMKHGIMHLNVMSPAGIWTDETCLRGLF